MADISKDALRREITAILKDADLATTSAKKVRQQVEEKLEVDLSDRKKEIDDLVMECLEKKEKAKDGGKKRPRDDDDNDDAESEEGDEDDEEEEEEEERKQKRTAAKKPVKRTKKGSSDEDSDEASDDNASDEEYSPTGKKGKAGKKGKGKGKKKGSDSDNDSDEDWNKSRRAAAPAKKAGGGGAKRGGGGYTRAYTLTPELATVVGQDSMARHEVVKKIWSIIKERNLYDPKNKQFAICDDELFKVFGVKRFRTFGMMKYLKNHFVD